MSVLRKNPFVPVFYVLFSLFSLFCITPIIAILSVSLTDENYIVYNGYSLIPRQINTLAYQYIINSSEGILHSYGVTIFVTGVGTLLSLFVITMVAYALSRRDYKFRGPLSLFIFITMIFHGGLVPSYIVVARFLHLYNTVWALIVPMLVNAYYIIIMRTFFQSIHIELVESAKMDGSSEFRIYRSIILPLSKPALATIGLFTVLGYWNDWYLPLLYIKPSNKDLITLQYMLYRIMSNIQFLTQQMIDINFSVDISKLPNESARMAMCIIAAGPMLVVFPAFQKYFVRGLTIGSVKG